jgi:uncharacterized protein
VRIVLDTSVLFAAFRLESGFCTDLFRACVLRHDLFISEYILEELQRHLIGKAKISSVKVAEVIESLRSFAIVVVPTPLPNDVCRDSDDVPVLGTAIAALADVLVTGDKDLLVLNPFRGVAVLSPRDFHARHAISAT